MIKFIKSAVGIGYGYSKDSTAEMNEVTEKELVESGFAEFVERAEATQPKKETATVKKPSKK